MAEVTRAVCFWKQEHDKLEKEISSLHDKYGNELQVLTLELEIAKSENQVKCQEIY
jgi:hypothetical protein